MINQYNKMRIKMEFFQVVSERYSYRGKFIEEAVPESDLKKIVQTGLDAPSGKNLQTTQFVIINEEEKINELRKILPDKLAVATGNAFIACIIDKEPELVIDDQHFQLEDCSAAVENMLLAITALGYASVWLDGVLRRNNISEQIGKLINCPESKKVQILLPVGKPFSPGPRKEKMKFEERVWMNSY